MNAIGNAVFMFYILIFCLSMSLVLGIGQELYDQINLVIDVTMYESIYNFFPTIRDLFINLTNFLLVYLVVLLLVSSSVERHDITSYFINFVGAVLVSSLILFLSSNFLSVFTHFGAGVLDFSILPDWFTTNFFYILVLNVLAGLMSFIFVKRG